MLVMSEREKTVRRRLRDEFPHYAAKCLNNLTKTGAVFPFQLSKVQRFVHERMKAQVAEDVSYSDRSLLA